MNIVLINVYYGGEILNTSIGVDSNFRVFGLMFDGNDDVGFSF
jgi:hypothetical protein